MIPIRHPWTRQPAQPRLSPARLSKFGICGGFIADGVFASPRDVFGRDPTTSVGVPGQYVGWTFVPVQSGLGARYYDDGEAARIISYATGAPSGSSATFLARIRVNTAATSPGVIARVAGGGYDTIPLWRGDSGGFRGRWQDSTFTEGGTWSLGAWYDIEICGSASSAILYANGSQIASVSAGAGTLQTSLDYGDVAGGGSNAGGFDIVYALWANRCLSRGEIDALRLNPWQLFEPRRIWVPVSAVGGSHSGAVSESGSSSDAVTASAAWLSAIAEATTAAELTGALLAMVAAASESGSVADAADALRALLAGASDSGAAEDAVAALASLLAAVNEPGAAADAQDGSTGSGHSGATEEAASAADTATAIAALLAASSETVGVSDAAAAIAALLAAVAEAGSAADVADWVAGASHSGAVSEAGAIAEAAAAAAALVGAVHDTSIVDDLAAAIADYRAALAEATQPQDVVAAAGALCAIVWAATAELRTFVPPPETRTWVAPPYSVKDLS